MAKRTREKCFIARPCCPALPLLEINVPAGTEITGVIQRISTNGPRPAVDIVPIENPVGHEASFFLPDPGFDYSLGYLQYFDQQNQVNAVVVVNTQRRKNVFQVILGEDDLNVLERNGYLGSNPPVALIGKTTFDVSLTLTLFA